MSLDTSHDDDADTRTNVPLSNHLRAVLQSWLGPLLGAYETAHHGERTMIDFVPNANELYAIIDTMGCFREPKARALLEDVHAAMKTNIEPTTKEKIAILNAVISNIHGFILFLANKGNIRRVIMEERDATHDLRHACNAGMGFEPVFQPWCDTNNQLMNEDDTQAAYERLLHLCAGLAWARNELRRSLPQET
jgi:hypothetical protein